MRHYNIPIFIPHLACPYDCIYCDQKKISAQLQVPQPDEILAIVEQHLSTIPQTAEVEIAFFGGNFTAIPLGLQEEYLSTLQTYLKSGRIQGIRISTRPDCIDPDGLEMLREYGVKTIELGVQSLNDKVLQASARRYKAEDVCKSSSLIHEKGFQLGIQLMVGLPGDNYERDIETVRETIKLEPQMVRIYPTLVIAGTELERRWEQGVYQTLLLDEAIAICKDMLLLFSAANIPVIRMGLYPGEELRRDGVVKAGPFHPAFKELVEQAIFREQTEMAIDHYIHQVGPCTHLVIHINERDLSKMLGPQRRNLAHLSQAYPFCELQVQTEPGSRRDWIGISSSEADAKHHILRRREFIDEYFGTKY